MDIIKENKYDEESFKKFKKLYTPKVKTTCLDETMKLIEDCLEAK